MNTKRQVASAVAVTVLAFLPATLRAQDAAYTVPGISAWTTAKTYGFVFHPEAGSGESVSRPLDGVTTLLTRSVKTLLTTQKVTVAQVIGGQPSVNQGERNTTFKMFWGRTLAPGWTVKSVDVTGNFTYVEQPRLGTNNLSFRVRLAPGGTATLRNVVLNGPAGADWKDAFSAPVRRDYVINGTVAWNAAKKYGFTFTPVKEGSTWGSGFTTGLPDGVFTTWSVHKRADREDITWRCTELPGPRALFESAACIIGQIAGGNMSVTVPRNPRLSSQSVAFEMFGAKRLSPGWIVKSVSTSNGSWSRQPSSGSDDLSFILVVTSYGNTPATAIVKSITLEGPSNAASYEDAFKNAQNPAQ